MLNRLSTPSVLSAALLCIAAAAAAAACASKDTTTPNGSNGDAGSRVASCDDVCAHVGDVCGATGACANACPGWTEELRMCAGEIGTCDELNLCGKSPAHDAGKNDTGTVPQGTCDGKPYCKDTNTKAVCTVKSGIGDTVETACSVGGCKDAKCGSCTSSTECKTTTQCKCQDGAFVSVEIGGTCSSGFCSLSFQGAAYCQSHGGSDKTYGDSVYHCDPSWQQQ